VDVFEQFPGRQGKLNSSVWVTVNSAKDGL